MKISGTSIVNQNLMRFQPEWNQPKFVPPSPELLEAQRAQIQRFNAQYQQQAIEHAAELQE